MGRGLEASAPAGGLLDGLLGRCEPGWSLQNPPSGYVLAPGATVFHDARHPNLLLMRRDDGLVITTYQFDGSYLSLAVDLPAPQQRRCRPGWRPIVRLTATASPRPATTFLRLNLSHRQNKKVLNEVVVLEEGDREVRFDLDSEAEGASSVWLDIILSQPRMSEVALTGVHVGFEEM